MKTTRQELTDDMMADINGGLDYLPDGKMSITGSIGWTKGELKYRYDNYALVSAYVNLHDVDKDWKSQKEFDDYMIEGMLAEGIIY